MHDDTIHVRYGDAAREEDLTALVERYGLEDHVTIEHDPDYDEVTVLDGRDPLGDRPTELPALEDYFERVRREIERAQRDPFRWPPEFQY